MLAMSKGPLPKVYGHLYKGAKIKVVRLACRKPDSGSE
ncbi:hypothetical protein E5Q_06402 [Mixia osmundae IAM 14324]|uniref:Uncharacterized protein n=1 Tax=Mixia osmundae (strain CBS 9802 / IAM 14324 / JCM 22182 / KY 12970) TaxID=764103 RepID=G7EA39_MIXOS|nr:hypothetical protein E5Q_06402 [Mixia osmundae IAM 14324]